MKFESVRFKYRGEEPAREIEVEPLVYSLKGGRLEEQKASSSRELEWRDALFFDSKFSSALAFSYVDLIHGDYEAEILEYEVPGDSTAVVEVFKISEEGKTRYLVLAHRSREAHPQILGEFERLEEALRSIPLKIFR